MLLSDHLFLHSAQKVATEMKIPFMEELFVFKMPRTTCDNNMIMGWYYLDYLNGNKVNPSVLTRIKQIEKCIHRIDEDGVSYESVVEFYKEVKIDIQMRIKNLWPAVVDLHKTYAASGFIINKLSLDYYTCSFMNEHKQLSLNDPTILIQKSSTEIEVDTEYITINNHVKYGNYNASIIAANIFKGPTSSALLKVFNPNIWNILTYELTL